MVGESVPKITEDDVRELATIIPVDNQAIWMMIIEAIHTNLNDSVITRTNDILCDRSDS